MSPIVEFEQAAQRAFASEGKPDVRAKRLQSVAAAIEAYLSRLSNRKGLPQDAWQRALVNRSLEYLRLLQRDVRILASEMLSGKYVASSDSA